MSRAVAEEIRLLVPPRLQLADTWRLGYSLEEDGVSLGTLYGKCGSGGIKRGSGFVLVVQDGAGGVGFPFPPSRFEWEYVGERSTRADVMVVYRSLGPI